MHIVLDRAIWGESGSERILACMQIAKSYFPNWTFFFVGKRAHYSVANELSFLGY